MPLRNALPGRLSPQLADYPAKTGEIWLGNLTYKHYFHHGRLLELLLRVVQGSRSDHAREGEIVP